ncbi:S66 peptidase family protein [Croceibacter atlanticus]|jgi:muramoyltetrapeptide carboxypeptidase|uniref:Putative carboxypeptidase n=1 Tax=Croceibacter atlanticus (strain ATCC BAA-628 / JCM 21780 / CIP 108009 / IAM 15332 / KCTC 12090 / HTCC2559) TaxID=216432 RepID=A3U6P8_CROAH|nr:LD-carboxypeptidase [Croceibacter atlanticus]EAP87915.1 putative carboxypeptidase [Croceibacter atlanticus HTCC2559]
MIIPPYLKEGDTVAIVCTARKISKKELDPAIKLLTHWGLKVKLGDTVGKEYHQFGGTDVQRAEDFQEMLDDKEVQAIWCARGGYGTVRMIDEVNFSSIETNPKWIIGYSDPTVLHCHIHNLGVATIHGQMCLEIENKTEATRDTLKNILFGNYDAIKFASDFKLNRTGHAKGQLIGGNLSVLSSILGSKSTIKTEGKILFLEDLDEYLYHIDRMVHNIKRNGFFKNLAGLVIGGLTDMHDNTSPFGQSAEEIIANAVKEFNFPVCFNFPAGHSKDNRALIFGAETELIVTKDNVVLKTEA